MTANHPYTPPPTTEMIARQNSDDVLRLLIAQRRLHNKAKFWQNLRWVGLLLIGLAAPVIAVVWPGAAVVVGAVAGIWLFLGRTLLAWIVGVRTASGAAVQERLDHAIYGMPNSIRRRAMPSAEELAKLAVANPSVQAVATKERLHDWYAFDGADQGSVAVAIAQRSNAGWSHQLLKLFCIIASAASVVWVIVLIGFSSWRDLSSAELLLGVVAPVLPAALDLIEYIQSLARAAADRGELADEIEGRLRARNTDPIESSALVAWQAELFELRRRTPQVPDWLYWLTRPKNEAAMHAVADDLRRDPGANP